MSMTTMHGKCRENVISMTLMTHGKYVKGVMSMTLTYSMVKVMCEGHHEYDADDA